MCLLLLLEMWILYNTIIDFHDYPWVCSCYEIVTEMVPKAIPKPLKACPGTVKDILENNLANRHAKDAEKACNCCLRNSKMSAKMHTQTLTIGFKACPGTAKNIIELKRRPEQPRDTQKDIKK